MPRQLAGAYALERGVWAYPRGRRIWLEDSALSELLSQLDGIANAPLTESQREARAKPVVEATGLKVEELASSFGRLDLEWNRKKAEEYDVSLQTWIHAVRAVGLPSAGSVSDLLYRLHQAEVAVRMLRSGYSPSESEAGELRWRHDEPDTASDTP